MTGLWIFAYVILPIAVLAMGYGAVILNERSLSRHDREVSG
jgi:hypothetical protein